MKQIITMSLCKHLPLKFNIRIKDLELGNIKYVVLIYLLVMSSLPCTAQIVLPYRMTPMMRFSGTYVNGEPQMHRQVFVQDDIVVSVDDCPEVTTAMLDKKRYLKKDNLGFYYGQAKEGNNSTWDFYVPESHVCIHIGYDSRYGMKAANEYADMVSFFLRQLRTGKYKGKELTIINP